MKNDPASRVQDYLAFGEFGGVNPSITDSSTFTFMTAEKMTEVFEHEIEGCFLYSRHLNPMNDYLAEALAQMEDTEEAKVTASGMSAISCAILQICSAGDEIVSSRTIYGGTYALMKNFLPKFNLNTKFVDITNLEAVEGAITPKTKVLFCETISNPLLEIADVPKLRKLADKFGIALIVDNTFSPMMISPVKHGAHIVAYSLTKFVNGASDCVAGAICAKKDFVSKMRDVNSGAAMLLGPTLDSLRAASILKNLRTLHVRMKKHSENAAYLAENLQKLGLKVHYPGLQTHKQRDLANSLINEGYGFGGMMTLDVEKAEKATRLMEIMQEEKIGFFAVSLGFYKTLFSSPGSSTSSEIPAEAQAEMGMSPGLVRFSIGLDADIEKTFERIKICLKKVDIL